MDTTRRRHVFARKVRCNDFHFYIIPDEDTRRPGQRPTTAMLGNEVMNKEQLYDLFQQILGVKKFEHQLLYNAMQVCKKNIPS